MTHSAFAPSRLTDHLSAPAREAPASGIVEVMNHGRAREGMIPLWAGEGDVPTPAFICEAAARGLRDGETFYTWQRGIPELRAALARYTARLYGVPEAVERFFVTGSGMQALQTALRMVGAGGDEVLIPTPAWVNFSAAIGVGGMAPVPVVMAYSSDRGWVLDLDRLAAGITPRTKAVIINSPSNPTGWTATRDELAAVLAIARRHGLWIIADEVYGRFVYDVERAASFHDVAEPDDRIIYINTFSKNWAMTGWRIGWIEAPVELGPVIENLIQYSTSGVAAFLQRAAVAALDEGEDFLRQQVERARTGRDTATRILGATNRVRFANPSGAFYLFFGIEGVTNTRRLGLQLVDEANVGLAPGTAFGPGGEGFLRMCFARSEPQVREASERIAAWIARQ
ncbi:aminotransferase [Agaricicola taiwanensis]|uniref:aspartate transaminase n=1 Tax=Agaricicola taiwanensis TaxID=591372 RepID=A0A8J2VNS7_9RHOB|nr:pyridoxal phosphate-dependent aminotransferase [Agaricicola taiwanensis]GGE31365.1 aminotransferase [Agaricicola taiwanensis]